MPAFKRVYKKLAAGQQAVVDDAVRAIIAEPEVGEAKKGDLAGVHVHKFPLNREEMPLAYEWTSKTRAVLLLGSRENFYHALKRG